MHNHSYENDLHVNEILFSFERMSTKTRFDKRLKEIRKWPITSLNKYSHIITHDATTLKNPGPRPVAPVPQNI